MKKFCIICCVSLAVLLASPAYAATTVNVDTEAKTVKVVSDGHVYVGRHQVNTVYTVGKTKLFKKPNKDSKVIKKVKKGTKLTRVMKGKTYSVVRISNVRNPKYVYVKNSRLSTKRIKSESTYPKDKYSPKHFRRAGVIHWGSWRWTWYSQRVLPGGGLKIPGRHVDSNGYVCDNKDRICLASSKLKKGTIVDTPFGKPGKVYDSGCASGTLDVYVNW